MFQTPLLFLSTLKTTPNDPWPSFVIIVKSANEADLDAHAGA